MSKGPYQATKIKNVDPEMLAAQFDYRTMTAAVDVAKRWMYVCLMGPHWDNYYVLKFDARKGLDRFVALLDGLPAEEIAVVLEPSGTYGDPLRHRVEQAGYTVKKMRPTKCQSADELFDHVPSLHDGKAAYLLARLHLMEVSEEWEQKSPVRREVRAHLRRLKRKEGQMNRLTGQLESLLGRHWPELTTQLGLTSASLLELLKEFGSAQAVAAEPRRAARLLEEASRGMLAAAKIERVIGSAARTEGLEPTGAEEEDLRDVVREMRRLQAQMRECRRDLASAMEDDEPTERMKEFGGLKVAVALLGYLGDPGDYGSASQYEKGAGLNLRERSSGKYKGELKITKRGPGQLRQYLYLLACRTVRADGCPYVRAWYQERLRRNGGCRMKGLVAVMRKLIAALYHIGRGAEYDPTKLFDVDRLDLKVVKV